jgi:ribosomal protein S18 acetylase RimI-like enzyme
MENFKILTNNISIENYRHIRKLCGLSEKTEAASKIGLGNTIFSISILNNTQFIGMGRIIGDNGTFAQIVDICVHPDYQGKGLGKTIMEHLMQYVNKLPKSCYVSLIADGNAKHLYEKFGFKVVEPESVGMALKIE